MVAAKSGAPSLARRALDGIARFDETEMSSIAGATAVRQCLALAVLAYAGVLIERTLERGDLPGIREMLTVLLGLALAGNRTGRFVRDWFPIMVGLIAYIGGAGLVERLRIGADYTVQPRLEKLLWNGHLPTAWLQEHLYRGPGGLLNLLVLVTYTSHFLVPIVLLFALWWSGRRRVFHQYALSILAVSLLAEVVFVLMPTAPPWLAANRGVIPPVHHVLKIELLHLHLGAVAARIGDPRSYNIVAALPSLHAAFPVIGLAVLIRNRLPWPLVALLASQLVAVLFAIIYSGEHYTIDAVGGIAVAILGFVIVGRLQRTPAIDRRMATHQRSRLGEPARDAT
jgi:hypothetical protein